MDNDFICPKCGTRMRYNIEEGKIMCDNCQFSPLDAKMEAQRQQGARQYVQITYRGEVNHNALAAFRTGHDYLHKGDKDKAAQAFKRATHFQADFVDAYLWLAEIANDEAAKRDYLGTVLALDGSNPDALRKLMVLNGRLTKEQAAQTNHYNEPTIQPIDIPVSTQTEALLCPVCSGNLTVEAETGKVVCRFCGFSEVRQQPPQEVESDLLSMALIERKVQPVKWVVGSRLLHCNECGAERTIPARKLSQVCPFCNSTQVILQDALQSFEQPDGLVRFEITREQAAEHIRQALEGMMQRLANLFNTNRVKRANIDGVYLPFWVFDATAQVTVTKTYQGGSRGRNFIARPVDSRDTFTDGLFDVMVSAVTSPPADQIARLGKYDLSASVPYEAKLLAKYPAELYDIDFDRASLEARSQVANWMRDKHGRKDTGDEQMRITVFSAVDQMSFRLLLLPVWIATLTEVDGDLRSALVNGQTGKVVLGKTQR